MGKPTGFVEVERLSPPKRAVADRVRDFREVEASFDVPTLRAQASRCMDCGIPFCHQGCPLGNDVPAFNDLLYRDRWREAIERLHATNNFPEFTGKTCPAPCEESCVLNVRSEPVTIKQIEKQLIERAWAEGWVRPLPAARKTGRSIAVIGSGPAGLAAAQQLARAGHDVTVFERDDRLGGLLRYGIPDFKLEKIDVDRRIAQMRAEGVVFRTRCAAGTDVSVEELRARFDAICVATGAQRARALDVAGAGLAGIHPAMDYLTQQNRRTAGDAIDAPILATGKHVVILGGGDTGADCLGTAHRQGAASVRHFHYKPAPPDARTVDMPWPWWPMTLRDSSSHEEGGTRGWSVIATRFAAGPDGRVASMTCAEVAWESGRVVETGRTFDVATDLVLVAIGFDGTDATPLVDALGVRLGRAHTIDVDDRWRTTVPGVFACGDARRGPSLVVWAIWEGRETARAIDQYLMGRSDLPTSPNTFPLTP